MLDCFSSSADMIIMTRLYHTLSFAVRVRTHLGVFLNLCYIIAYIFITTQLNKPRSSLKYLTLTNFEFGWFNQKLWLKVWVSLFFETPCIFRPISLLRFENFIKLNKLNLNHLLSTFENTHIPLQLNTEQCIETAPYPYRVSQKEWYIISEKY